MILAASVAFATLALSAPVDAAGIKFIKITSNTADYLQIAELRALVGNTNVALASNGSVASAFSSLFGFTGPDKVNDGLIDGQPYGEGIYISGSGGPSEYLLLTLPRSYNLTGLTIFGREDCCQGRDVFKYELLRADGTSAGAPGIIDASGQAPNNSGSVALVAAVPEPASWGMMVLGFGMAGFGLRSRRKSKVSFA